MKTLKKFGLIVACFATIVCAWQIYNYFYAPVIPKSQLQKVPKGYSDIVIFVDFKEPSGRNRFIVYDKSKNKVQLRANCSHGQGGGSTMRNPVFSNQPSSNCSSLGRYKIVSPGRMSNGYPSYVLEGLDPTNSNARMRQILIHPSKVVSAFGFGAYPFYLPLKKVSSGCFTISFFNFKKLRHIINRETKPVMLIAYY